MITAKDIRWSRYKQHEGPFFRGITPYQTPPNPDFLDKVLSVFTATEGGRFEALNMYDKCMLSLGLIQSCERAKIYGISKMLLFCANANRTHFEACLKFMAASPEFTDKGQFVHNGKVVTTISDQQKLLLGTTGTQGSWSNESKAYAKQNAAGLASIFTDLNLQSAQIAYIRPRMLQYVMKDAKKILFTRPDEDGWWGALKAAYVSFAGNIPVTANKWMKIAAQDPKWATASDEDKCIMALKTLTFGPKITIWPHRYNAIRKTLERLFDVDLPDFAKELKEWDAEIGHENFRTIEEVQAALDYLGYDIGPTGMDGKFGEKTSAALKKFEEDHDLMADGLIDEVTSITLRRAVETAAGQSQLKRLIDLSDSVMRGGDDLRTIINDIKAGKYTY
jgi:hypothetical protein